MYDLSKVVVTSSPHIKASEDTRSLMLDVVLAMIPALAVSVVTFGLRALIMTLVTVVSCVAFEFLYNKAVHSKCTVCDLSAVVTGILLAFNLPVGTPLWMPVIGAGFAIIITKMLFGGIGRNFMNPALAGRAFLMASWPAYMTAFTKPGAPLSLFGTVEMTDAITTATPLAALKQGATPDASLMNMFLGQTGGVLGETCALALLVGGAYLLMRKVITINIPAAYILTVAVISFLFPAAGWTGSNLDFMLSQVLSGGLMLGAIFMATDYVTSPVTPKGQIVFGIGCGLLTVFIRYFGGMSEGVSYSILIMNALVWTIDQYCLPRKFGYAAKQPKAEKKGA